MTGALVDTSKGHWLFAYTYTRVLSVHNVCAQLYSGSPSQKFILPTDEPVDFSTGYLFFYHNTRHFVNQLKIKCIAGLRLIKQNRKSF